MRLAEEEQNKVMGWEPRKVEEDLGPPGAASGSPKATLSSLIPRQKLFSSPIFIQLAVICKT